VQFHGVRVDAGGASILDVPWLDVPAGQTTAVLGPNGAGKSTLVRVAAGLREPDAGEVALDGAAAASAERRAIAAAVLQRPLLGHGSARRNAELGLRFAGVAREEARRRAAAWLERLGVAHLADRRARSLSGGEAQRISLARALVLEPRLLVLDEPFAPLDAASRAALLDELRTVLADANTTTLLVTHDPGEAAALASHLAVLAGGAVHQQGPVADVFAAPADEITARLLGYDNVLDPAGAARLGLTSRSPVAFRAADLDVTPAPGTARAVRSIPVAGGSRIVVDVEGVTAIGFSPALGGLPPGSPVDVRLAVERCVRLEVTPRPRHRTRRHRRGRPT
jgi:ABC-type sulfate/molybdate transport systems ATPase subunit